MTYGDFSVTADGQWTFTLDNTSSAIQSLTDADQVTLTIPTVTGDGTTINVSVTVNGADDVVSGHAIDGYIEGATIFGDANGNRQWDQGEVTGTTGTDGAYSLTNSEGPLVLHGNAGAKDIATGLTFKGLLEAPAGSSVVTPLTTSKE